MADLDNKNSRKRLINEYTYCNQANSQCHGENVNIIIVTRKRFKKRKNHNVFMQAQQYRVPSRLSRFSRSKKQVSITRHSSMPELNECTWPTPSRNRSGRRKDTIQNKYKLSPFCSNFIANVASEHRFDERLCPFSYRRQIKLLIYRCEFGGTVDNNCCCTCNSDAMFEIMRGLYECYKKRDCTNCTCILCSHIKPEDKLKLSEREKVLREQAMKGFPLPEGKTSSEKKLINKVRTDLGVPIEPKTKEIRDKHEEASKAGKLLPLEGKTPAEKEKILQDLFDMGIPLPKGRTPSEKALIAKISGKPPSEVISLAPAHSEQMRRAQADGILTPLKGKSPEQKENILKKLAMIGLPLPEGQSPSENKLIEKVRTDLGLPIEPKSKDIRDKHEKASKARKLLPLEGKTPEKKEKILEGLHNMGIPLPIGRTPSEKSLIAKIAASPRSPSQAASVTLSPSERMRRAQEDGLLTSLKGKTPKQREKILRGLAMKGLPLPEAQSKSEKKLIKKVRRDLGVPIEPKTKAIRKKHEEAAKAGKLLPLEGKKTAKKKKILEDLHNMGIPLPEGRTPSEKALIAEIKSKKPTEAVSEAPSELMRRPKEEELLTPLSGKTPEQKEKIVKGLAMKGLPLPEAQSPSEKKLIDKVRTDLGLPKDPTTKSMKDRHDQAAKAGLLQPLEGKTPAEKEKVLKGLRDLGIPLPEGRTPSEKDLIEKVKASSRSVIAPSEQLRRAKAEGLLTPLKGKPPEQKENILKGLAMRGLPLPEGESPSEKKLIDKVRADLGLPKEPTTKSMKDRHDQAAKAGLLQPLEGKTPAAKEKVLKGLHELGIPLPEGRTPSEKDLIEKVKATPRSIIAPSEQLRRAKAEGLLTPLKGKSPEQKEKILKGLAMKGLALPEGQSPSEKKLIEKVRADLGLPKEPSTKSLKVKHEQAAKAGLLQPLEGKTPAEKAKLLKGLRDLGIPLPEGRTPSEKALIGKVKESLPSVIAPSEQMRRAKAEGLLTPLKGKSPEQKEKILKGLAMKGLALPEGQSPSEKKLIEKVRADLGLPKEPSTKSLKVKHEQAAKAGLLQPLEGKTPAEKAKLLKGLRDMGIPLPEGRTPSEKALIGKVKESLPSVIAPSEQMRRAKAEGLLTPLKGKPPEQKEKILKGLAMKGLALPEGQSPSEKNLIDKVRADLGLPNVPTTKSMKLKHEQAAKAGLLQPLEGKTPAEKANVLKGLRDLGIPLPEGRTPSEKALIEKVKASSRSIISPSELLRRAKVEGLLTPLKGKPPEQKEKILKGLAMKGLALPEAQSPSEKKLIDKVRADLGLPKDPSTKSLKVKHEQAAKAGLLQPLEGKTPAEKENLLKGLRDLGIPLPEGRTPSEKDLIEKVKASARSVIAPSEQLRRAKAEGLLTPLKGKPLERKEKILKGLAMKGLPLPEGQSASEKKLIDKVRADLGLPNIPTTKSMKLKHKQAAKAGLLQPLEGKTPTEKEKVLKGLRDLGIPLPEGRTPSEKALIEKIKASSRSIIAPSELLRRAKAEGLLTPLKGKPPEQKEKILKGLAMKGLPLPEGQSPSEKKLIDKVRADLGLPKEPSTTSLKDKHKQAAKAGLLQPLEGKTPAEKEKVLKGLRDLGIPLPEGRTPSEKALIKKVKELPRSVFAFSKQLRRAKAEGLLTPLKGKTPEDREKILKGLAMRGIPLPEGQSPSENKIIDKVRTDLGLPIEPTTKEIRDKHTKASKFGKLIPLEGKTPKQKENILARLHNMGIPLPVGRTPSEKSLIARITACPRIPCPCWSIKSSSVALSPSEHMHGAKTEGLLTPLKGKTPEQKEKIVKGIAMKGLLLPEATSPSEKKLIDKVRADLGLPIDPTTKSMKKRHEKAAKAGLLQPLEGKTPKQKEKALKGLRDLGIPLPEGRTPSEKALIKKIKASPPSIIAPSEQLRRAKVEGLLTPLKGKSPEQKENIVKGLAMKGLPLPEAESPSEKKLIDKVRADLGLPKDPTTKSMKDRHDLAAKAGLLQPLEGKTPAEKEKVLKGLRDLGIPLPEGRTPSEKDLIKKVKASSRSVIAPSEQLRRAKAEGLLTPLKGKPPEQKEKILKGLAMKGLALPEAQSPSEKKLIDKVRTDLGLPKDPTTKSMKDRHDQAAKAGLLQPLEGKTPAEKEKVLKGLRDLGIPLPEGRTPSEKDLIEKVKASSRSVIAPSEQLRRAKAEGLLTPLKGKPPEQKEKILKGLAMKGLALPEAQSPSEKKLVDKVRADLGLPKDPTTKSMKDRHDQAAKAGLLQPLEGKTPAEKEKVLKGLRDLGIPLPEGRTPSEKDLIEKVKASSRSVIAPSEKLRRAKAEGLLTPLKGKPPEQKEKILKGLAMKGLALPEGQSPSEKKLIDKVRADLGLPKDPTTKSMKDRHDQAAKAGLLQPLEGKTPAEKEKVLKGLRDLGIPLPEGRTPSEKDLIKKVKASSRSVIAPSEQLRRAKAEGLLTPLKGKPLEQKEKILKGLAMKGLALPEAQSPSEKKLVDKVRADLGLPMDPTTKSMKDRHDQAAKAGLLQPLEGKTPAEKEKVLKGLRDLGIPLPEGRTPSEKKIIKKVKASTRSVIAPSEKLRRAKAEGLLTPLKGKPLEQKEKILKGLALKGLALPEAQSPSEKKLIDKVRADLGLPKDPTTKSMKDRHDQAAKTGLLQPLEGKTPAEKEKVLKGLHDLGIPLPEGRTPSEKDLIEKVKASSRSVIVPSEQLRRAKAEGLLTPLKGKPPEQKEKILKGLAMKGLALPEAQSPSEKKLIDKVRTDLGLPNDPTTKSMKDRHDQAAKAGLLQPLEGKTPAEKEKVLKGLHDLGIPLPEGRTPSEKDLIEKVKASSRSVIAPSEQLRRAKAEGLLTPLKGKPPEQKEKILKGLAMKGLALPEAQSPSEKKLVDKVRADLGLPKDPTTKSMKDRHGQAAKAGLLQPLEGKTPAEKAKVLKGLRDLGIPLPEGRTPSEKDLIEKVKASSRSIIAPSEQLRRAKAEGLLTPLKGKPPEQKEKILKGLAMKGLALPEAQSPSEKKLIDKVRADLGLPKDPTTKSMKLKHEQAAKAGLLQPLEGKTNTEKAKVLKGLRDLGIPLPEGRTSSEKALIAKVKTSSRSVIALSERLRKAKAEGLLTPLKGKPPEQKEKILKGLAMKGLALPEAQSPSENKLIDKVRADLGLPKNPKSKAMKEKHLQAAKAGLLQPLEGKTNTEKAEILKGLRDLGIPLPEGRTPSEKALINKVKASSRTAILPSEQLRRAEAEGLLTPLEGKPREQKEKILKGLAMKGLALPEAQSPSGKKLIDKVRADLGLPKDPTTKSMKLKHEQAAKAGLLQPLEGKTNTEKAKILKGLRNLGIPLPEGRTPSEKALINKVKASSQTVIAPSEQLRRAQAEGLLTPLKGKPLEQKEKILKGLAMKGLALPEAQSPSEKKLIDKVRTDLGLPKDPTTKSMKEKHEQAAKAGLLQPLEGKTTAEKTKVLKGLRDLGIPLPEGRTPSENALIAKVKTSSRSVIALSERLRKAKEEGLLTSLKGKTLQEREKILRGLAMKGLPLPEGKSPSEIELIDKVRTDLGLPIEPETKDIRYKHDKAAKAGKLLPLEGKTSAQKKKILKDFHNMGIPLPIGRTSSEKYLISKIAASPRGPLKVVSATLSHSEQLRAAEAEGLLTPLKNKTPEEREKVLKGLAMKGLPLPEGQSPSENKLILKVRTDLGLPIEPETKDIRGKHDKAAKAGKLLPLEGKTSAQKKKILKDLHNMGIPLPIGRTPSEKSLISKIAASPRGPSKAVSATLSPSEQLHAAEAEGLLTSLKNKTPEEREKVLKGLAMKGLPLPEGQSLSENKLIVKVRTDLGLPTEPNTTVIRDKHDKAAKAGKLLPLEGKTSAQKKKILKDLHNMGIPLPIGRTPSEKSLIAKIAASPRGPSKASATLSPSEQLRAAKAEGLLTPLRNKTSEEREKILRGLAMTGLPLPEGQSPSENKLIDKVRTDLGLPIEPTTKDIRDKHEQASKAGKLLPLEGKTSEKKEKILKDLHDMGIPLPIGRTASEKALIAKVMAGLATGVTEQYEEIEKTTKCDRACGCDRKKIRFKHSYIKIKVTSPDISSFCDCPDECFPRVKSGVIIDNEGIKVTVASALGIPSFTANYKNYNITLDEFSSKKNYIRTHTEYKGPKKLIGPKSIVPSFESSLVSSKVSYVLSNSSYFESSSTRPNSTESENIYLQNSTLPLPSKLEQTVKSNLNPTSKTISTASSLASILVLKSQMSLCSTISNKTMNTVSLTSVMNSSITSTSTRYSSYQSTDDPRSRSSLEQLSTSDYLINHPATIGECKSLWNIESATPEREYTILRVNQTILDFGNSEVRTNVLNYEEDPVVLMDDLQSKLDVSKIINKILAKKRFADASSIFIVVPMSEDEEEPVSSNRINSMTSIYSYESEAILKDTSEEDPNLALRLHSYAKRSEQTCSKGKSFYMKEISSSDNETMFQNESVQALCPIEMMTDEVCQISRPDEIAEMLEKVVPAIGTDTTTSIPGCCCPKEYPNPFVVQNCSPNQHCTANVISREKKYRSLQGLTSGRCHLPDMRTPKPSLRLLDLHATCKVLTQTSSGFRPIAHKATSCSHVPDMRTPSSMSLMQPCDKPAAVGSRLLPKSAKSSCCLLDMRTPSSLVQLRDSSSAMKSRMLPIKTPGCGRLLDMRTPSARSSDLPCAAPTQSSVGSSHFPHKTTSYCRLPDMPSAESSILQSEVGSSSGDDWSSRCLSDETCGCCRSPASIESAKLLSDIPTCSDGHVSLDNSLRVPARLGHDMHYSRIETTSSQRNCRDLSSHTIKTPSTSCNKLKTTFKTYPDEVKSSIAFENPTRTSSIQHLASQQSYMSIDSPDEEDCLCEDIEGTDIIPHEILIPKLRIQESRKAKLQIDSTDVDDYMDFGTDILSEPQIEVSRKSEMPKDFVEEDCWHFYCGCEDTENIDNMSYRKLRLQAGGNSKMPMDPTDGEHCLCENIENTNETSTQQPQFQRSRKTKKLKHYALKDDFESKDEERLDINTIKMRIQLQPPQTNWKSKMQIDSIDEEDCLCEDIEGTDPQLQASGNSKMPINPANGDHCLCENAEVPNIIIDEISNNRPQSQVNRKPKVPNYSTVEDKCLCKQIQGTDNIPNQEPQIQVTRKFKMPINPSDGNHCTCEEKEGTNERSIQQTRFQASPMSKKLKASTIKEDFENIGAEPPGITPDELGNQHPPPHVNWKSIKLKNSTVKEDYKIQQKSKNLTFKDCECEQQSKDSVTKVNCECLRQSKDFATKANCECPQHSKESVTEVNCECPRQSKDFAIKANCQCQQHPPSANKENSEYQQQTVSTSIGVCPCEEIAARNRLCITSQGQQQDRASTNSSKITTLITRFGKSISHKIHKTRKDKSMEKSVKSKSDHNTQTTPEQVLQPQQISQNVPSEPEVVNDGYPHEYSCGWIDYTTLMRLRSELTETMSGFKVCKKRNKRGRTIGSILEKPNAEIELDFEDAIKYYVGKNLDQFRDLISPIELLQKTAQGANKNAEKNGKDSSEGSDTNIDNCFGCCECPHGSVPLKTSYESITLTPEDSAELATRYPKGFKFSLGGTGLQPALDGPDAARKPDHTGAGA